MKVIQLSTRLSEGGAARVALDVHEGLISRGDSSEYYYGYGPSGNVSPLEDTIPNAVKLGSKMRAGLNMISYRLTGYDCVEPIPISFDRLTSSCKSADILHIHGVHSFFFPLEALIDLLENTNIKVVLTLHDYWWITGRCAFLSGCDRWKSGCGQCITLENYPKVWIDNSDRVARKKRMLLKTFQSRISVISPARHIARDFNAVFPRIEVNIIPNACDDIFHNSPRRYTDDKSTYKLALVAADFSDFVKYPKDLLVRVSKISGIAPVLIGRNSHKIKEFIPSAIGVGEVKSRAEMASELAKCDGFLFLSLNDIFPLSLIEALASGCEIFAIKSEAAQEVLDFVNQKCYETLASLFDGLQSIDSNKIARHSERSKEMRSRAARVFSRSTFIDNHYNFYRSIL